MTHPRVLAPSAPSDAGAAPIRAATPSDLGAVTDHWIEITRHHASADPLFELRSNARPEVERLVAAILGDPDARAWVWDEDGAVAGVCIVRIDRAPPILRETRRAEITDVGVSPERRRQGIARALVAQALAWVRSRDVERVEVRVAARNPEAQAFWRRLGFDPLMDVLQKRL